MYVSDIFLFRFPNRIQRLRESGILDKVLSEETAKAAECLKPLTSFALPTQRQLQLADFYTIFGLYGSGKGQNNEVFVVY